MPAGVEAREAVHQHVQQGATGEQGAAELRRQVDRHLGPGHPAAQRGADRDGRVEVGARDPADGVGHHQHGQAEGERGRDVVPAADQGCSAAEEHQHEGAEHLRGDRL